MRERPVASEKIAVDRASRRPRPAATGAATARVGRHGHAVSIRTRSATIRGPLVRAFSRMPNIKQQKKRVRTAAQERLENLRYRSTVKTLTRRLAAAVDDGDEERDRRGAQRARPLDRPRRRARRAPRNTAARKKSQAARLVAGSGSLARGARRLGRRVISTSARSSSSSPDSRLPPLSARSSSARRTTRVAAARPACSSRACANAFSDVNGCIFRRSAPRRAERTPCAVERLAGAHARRRGSRAGRRAAAGLARARRRALEQPSHAASTLADVALSPRVGERRTAASRPEPATSIARPRLADPSRRPPRWRASRPRSRARSRSSPTSSTSGAAGLAVGLRRRAARTASRPRSAGRPAARPRVAVVDEHLAGLGDGLRERRVLLQLAADEREHRRRARGSSRYAATAFASAAFQRSTSSTMTSRRSPPKRPSALQAATTSSPLVSCALEVLDRVLAEAVAEPLERARRSSAGRCRDQVDGLELAPSPPSIGAPPRPHREQRRAAARPERTCATGQAADDARAGGEVGGAPAVEPGDALAAGGETGATSAAAKREPEQRRDRRRGERVRRHGEQRDGVELQPEDRRRRDAAGGRDGDHAREARRAAGSPRGRAAAAARARRSPRPRRTRAGSRRRAACTGSTRAARARPAGRSASGRAGRAASQASEPSAPATPARTTDGCAPTAST